MFQVWILSLFVKVSSPSTKAHDSFFSSSKKPITLIVSTDAERNIEIASDYQSGFWAPVSYESVAFFLLNILFKCENYYIIWPTLLKPWTNSKKNVRFHTQSLTPYSFGLSLFGLRSWANSANQTEQSKVRELPGNGFVVFHEIVSDWHIRLKIRWLAQVEKAIISALGLIRYLTNY